MTAPTRRGPYRRRKKLDVTDDSWKQGDSYTDGTRRWIITAIGADGSVQLESSNTVNHGIRWTTTLAALPPKEKK